MHEAVIKIDKSITLIVLNDSIDENKNFQRRVKYKIKKKIIISAEEDLKILKNLMKSLANLVCICCTSICECFNHF